MKETTDQLISLFLFDRASMSQEQMNELANWLRQHPDNIRAFIQSGMFHRDIHELFVRSDNVGDLVQSFDIPEAHKKDIEDPEVWRLLSEQEKTAPSIAVKSLENKSKPVIIDKTRIQSSPRQMNKFSIATAIISLAALILMIVYVHLVPVTVHEEVATLIDTIDAQWAESAVSIKKGARIDTNTEPFMLRKGVAKLLFDNNTSVVVEGPAEFVLVSYDQIKLNTGRLYAIVPQEAIGFTVTTQNSKIIDLGTEFGVQVDFGETTQLHVVKGKTTLVADQEGKKVSLQVNEGSAKKISDRSSEVLDIHCDKQLFVRDIQSDRDLIWRGGPLELAEMLHGSGGVNGKVNGSFNNKRTGAERAVTLQSPELPPHSVYPVNDSVFVDGLFVPNGIHGPIPISQDQRFLWDAPSMEVRQKIGYLRFDISSIQGNRSGAILSLSIRKWAGKKGEVRVYGLIDENADHWSENELTYNTAAGVVPAEIGQYDLDYGALENLGTIAFNGIGTQDSDPSTLRLDEFIAKDTNGLLTFVLIRDQNDLSAEWMIRTKEADAQSAPKLTFPHGNGSDPVEVTTAFGKGADTYLSNDNQYESTGPDDTHGTETVFKIRNFIKNICYVTNAGSTIYTQNGLSPSRPFMLDEIVCGTQEHPVLAMRSNSGITFDLQEIRNHYNGIVNLRSFTAVCGPAEVTADYLASQQWEGSLPQSGFYVLVDGAERFSKIDMKPGEPMCPIRIDLNGQDRYLTLVVTGSTDRKVPQDWGLFVRPRLMIE